MLKLLQKKKVYKLNPLGIAQMQLDCKKDTINKISGYLGIVLIIGFCLGGLLSTELTFLLLANKGINGIASLVIG